MIGFVELLTAGLWHLLIDEKAPGITKLSLFSVHIENGLLVLKDDRKSASSEQLHVRRALQDDVPELLDLSPIRNSANLGWRSLPSKFNVFRAFGLLISFFGIFFFDDSLKIDNLESIVWRFAVILSLHFFKLVCVLVGDLGILNSPSKSIFLFLELFALLNIW